MVFQCDLRPAFVDPIPPASLQMRRFMLATSLLVDGFLDIQPGRYQPYLENTFLMPHASLLIGGTLCRRPLVLREFADVCRGSDLDGILVRMPVTGDNPSFDIKIAGSDRMLLMHMLWLPQPSGPPWLIPSVGSGPAIRLSPLGITAENTMPFDSIEDRHRGLRFGFEFLSVAAKGWF